MGRDYQNVRNKAILSLFTFVSVSGGGRFLLFSPREKIRGSRLSLHYFVLSRALACALERERE